MSPLEKAQQLKESFNNSLTAKDCCLVALEEILQTCHWEQTGFWMSVKQEIENL
jgi:hypothetical protein